MKYVQATLLLIVLALLASGCSGASDPAASDSLLFVQNASGGSLNDQGDGTLRLTLTGNGRTLFLSDRPARVTGSSTAEEFVNTWAPYGFDADAPNAILETAEGGVVLATALELFSPSYDAATDRLIFTVRPLAEVDISGDFGSATLFIDNAAVSDTQTARLQITFTDLATKNPVTVRIQSPATLILGTLNLEAIAPPDGSAPAPVSLNELKIAPDSILINPGDTTNFTLSVSASVPTGSTSLSGDVVIDAGSMTLGQIGSSATATRNASGSFSIPLDL